MAAETTTDAPADEILVEETFCGPSPSAGLPTTGKPGNCWFCATRLWWR